MATVATSTAASRATEPLRSSNSGRSNNNAKNKYTLVPTEMFSRHQDETSYTSRINADLKEKTEVKKMRDGPLQKKKTVAGRISSLIFLL